MATMKTDYATTENIPWDLNNPVEIAKGFYGVVYRATADKEFNRPVYAVKKISVDHFKLYYYRYNNGYVSGWLKQLLSEVQALKSLSNDHVVKYHHCRFEGEQAELYNNGEEPSEPDYTSGQAEKRVTFFFIQMEYCNSDLRKWLKQRNSHESRVITEIHKIFQHTLTGLKYIHGKKITHRDLKPENILIMETEGSRQIKIGDFGLATSNLNELNDKAVGTTIYLSPEMNSKTDNRDSKTDIYSLGLVFLECCDPRLNDSRETVFKLILNGVYEFPQLIQTKFFNEVGLVRNMTILDKNERFGAKQALEYLKNKVLSSANKDCSWISNMNVNRASSGRGYEDGVSILGQCNSLNQNLSCSIVGNSELKASSSKRPYNTEWNTSAEIRPSKIVRSREEVRWPITHGLLLAASNFSGRKEELTRLTSYFNSKTNLIFVRGLGGIGKSEFCKKFANDISSQSSPEDPISRVWLQADTLDTLRTSILKLANYLGVTKKGDLSPSEYFQYLVSVILNNSARLLVIVDNANGYGEVTRVISLVQKTENDGLFIIVTSRNRTAIEPEESPIELGVLSMDESRSLLQASKVDLTENEANEICKLVHCYPLALQQALAYIKQQRNKASTKKYSIADFIKEFETKKIQVMSQSLSKIMHDYEWTTLVTWNITFEKLTETAKRILNVLAHLEPDAIESDFVKGICKHNNVLTDDVEFRDGLDIIYNYSLVNIEDERISIHRLVQEVVRYNINDPSYSKYLFRSVLFVCTIRRYCPETKENSESNSADLNFNYYPGTDVLHLNSVSSLAYNCVVDSILNFYLYKDIPLRFLLHHNLVDCAVDYIELRFKTTIFSRDLTDEEKKELLEKIFLWFIVSGEKNETDEVIINGTYECSEDSSPSVESLERALNLAAKYFGENSEMILKVKNKMAQQLWHSRLCQEALVLCEEIISAKFYKQHKYAYQTMNGIGHTLFKEKNMQKSTEIFERVLEYRIEHLGKGHRDTLETMEILAYTLDQNGDAQKSQEMFKQLYQHLKQVGQENKLNEYISNVIIQRIKLSDSKEEERKEFTKKEIEAEYSDVNFYNFELSKLDIILPFYERVLGDEHIMTNKVRNATAWKLTHDRQRSIGLCIQVLSLPVQTEYEDAFKTLSTGSFDYEIQKMHLENLLERKLLELGDGHSNTIRIKEFLANTLEKLGELQMALGYFEQVRDAGISFEWNEEDLECCQLNVARVKLRIGDLSGLTRPEDFYREFKAIKCYRRGGSWWTGYDGKLTLVELQRILPFYKNILGDNDKLTVQVKNAIAEWLIGTEKYDESIALVEEVIKSNDKEEIIVAYENMQYIGMSLRYPNPEKSEELLERVEQYRIHFPGE